MANKTNSKAIETLQGLAESWGGCIKLVRLGTYLDVLEEANNELGRYKTKWTTPPNDGYILNHKDKELIVREDLADPGLIIHEMGHAFACNSHPDAADEWEFFGWEVCVARKVRCYKEWSRGSNDYSVGTLEHDAGASDSNLSSWKELTARQKQQVIKGRIEYAIYLELVTPEGVPVAIR